jgi:hypothetical protein
MPCPGAALDTLVDSCPCRPGVDDVTNFMDDSSDDCSLHFTCGQARRMHAAYWLYRAWGTGARASAATSSTGDRSRRGVASFADVAEMIRAVRLARAQGMPARCLSRAKLAISNTSSRPTLIMRDHVSPPPPVTDCN